MCFNCDILKSKYDGKGELATIVKNKFVNKNLLLQFKRTTRVYGSFLGYSDSIVFDGTGILSILQSIFFVLPDYPGLCSSANSCKVLSVLIL